MRSSQMNPRLRRQKRARSHVRLGNTGFSQLKKATFAFIVHGIQTMLRKYREASMYTLSRMLVRRTTCARTVHAEHFPFVDEYRASFSEVVRSNIIELNILGNSETENTFVPWQYGPFRFVDSLCPSLLLEFRLSRHFGSFNNVNPEFEKAGTEMESVYVYTTTTNENKMKPT